MRESRGTGGSGRQGEGAGSGEERGRGCGAGQSRENGTDGVRQRRRGKKADGGESGRETEGGWGRRVGEDMEGGREGGVAERVVSMLCWNVEGARGYVRRTGENRLEGGEEILALVETFVEREEDSVELRGAKQYHALAERKEERGRASGGCMIAVRGGLRSRLNRRTGRVVSVRVDMGVVVAGYFPPGTEVEEIVEEVGQHVGGLEGGAIVYGDFNCRLDNGGERGLRLREAMESMGFTLLNEEGEMTYFGGGERGGG